MSNSINSSGFSGYKGGSSGSGNSGGSGGSVGGGGRGGSYSPNATFINTDNRQYVKPRSIINVISDIQHYCMAEKLGNALPAEYLTLENSLGFFGVGAKSGLTEGLFLLLLLPAVEFYLLPFVLKSPSFLLKTMFGSFPFLPVIANTLLCAYISQYFVGIVTRKAINAFFTGRMLVLVAKSFMIYVFYTLLIGLSTPERVWQVAQYSSNNSEAIYYGYMTMLPNIMPIATRCSLFVLIAAILPYGTVFIMDMWRRSKIKRNHARITGKS
jgi:hypothetical protein